MRGLVLLCLLLTLAGAFFPPDHGGAVEWSSSPHKDNVFDSHHVQARHVKGKSTKGTKESYSSKSKRTKSSSTGSVSSVSENSGSETKSAKQDPPSPESESMSASESVESSANQEVESSSTASEDTSDEQSSESDHVEDRSRDSEDVLNGGTGDAMDGRNPGLRPPSPSPTCVECDDYPGEDKKSESLVVNVAPPSPSPTCVECDDGPKPTRPPSHIPMPDKNPTASTLAGTGTLIDIETDGDRDAPEDTLLYNFGDEMDELSGSTPMLSGSTLFACGVGFLLSLWILK